MHFLEKKWRIVIEYNNQLYCLFQANLVSEMPDKSKDIIWCSNDMKIHYRHETAPLIDLQHRPQWPNKPRDGL